MIDDSNPLDLCDRAEMSVGGMKIHQLHIPMLQIYQSNVSGSLPQKEYHRHLCIMLTIAAYEAIRIRNVQTPLVEYLRHLRNACAHGNRFNLSANEPARPASWQTYVIDHQLRGDANPLQGKMVFGEYFWVADILQLLSDVERELLDIS